MDISLSNSARAHLALLLPMLEELVRLAAKGDTRPQEDACRRVFQKYDKDDDGCITPYELKVVLNVELGLCLSQSLLDRALREMDANRSGEVSWQEFRSWWFTSGSSFAMEALTEIRHTLRYISCYQAPSHRQITETNGCSC